MTWQQFIYHWVDIAHWYAKHESYRRAGYKVSFDEHGTVIRHPLAVAYYDLI